MNDDICILQVKMSSALWHHQIASWRGKKFHFRINRCYRKYHQWYNKVRLYKINPEITINKCQLQPESIISVRTATISWGINYLYWRRFLFQIKLKYMSVYTSTDNQSPLFYVNNGGYNGVFIYSLRHKGIGIISLNSFHQNLFKYLQTCIFNQ